jgi:putrescine transport system ATP-binding protein
MTTEAADAAMALLEIVGAAKHFGATAAVDGVSLSIDRGAFFALLGPSGCGKTTLLRMIAGFEAPEKGRIVIDGVDVTALPPYARPVNMMFQSYALFPHMDVAGNIAFGLRREGMDRQRIAVCVDEMLGLVQMTGYARRRPHELSGGQRQRVALARALAKMPKLLLLDEPLAALDRKLRAETRIELVGIQERVGITFLVVTHDQEEALSMASRVAVMKEGRLVQIGSPSEIYERPSSRFVTDFVGEVNLFEGELAAGFNCSTLAVAGFEPIPLPPGTDLLHGTAAALAVRPEKLVLSPAPPAGFAIAAMVSSISYLGGGSIVHLVASQGRTLKAYLPGAAAARFARGDAIWVHWSSEDGVVLTE